MKPAFVDTSAWVAMIDRQDSLHAQAMEAFSGLRLKRTPLMTTEFVLLEVANSLSRPPLRTQAVRFLGGLHHERDLTIIPASTELFAEGWALFGQRPDKSWSLTDCISFAAMMREGVAEAFTSDHHFTQAGFVKLLSIP